MVASGRDVVSAWLSGVRKMGVNVDVIVRDRNSPPDAGTGVDL